ncbi:hypothetical protein C0995_000993 [Termitomyces sp. Mi166|nr:hypothetical protein C0995_000993 [Termitomyces sp. Mi166\
MAKSHDEIFSDPSSPSGLNKCLDAAKSVIRNMVENLAPTGYMRYAPDGHFIFASFASAFLLMLLKPEFSSLLSKEQETEVFDLIGRLIQTLSSPEIAIDDRHTPKLYARFLAGLLSRHRRDGATVGRLHPHPPPSNDSASRDFAHSDAPTSTSTFSVTSNGSPTQGSSFGGSFQQDGKMDTTPIYQPEATFSATGAIHFGSDVGVSAFGGGMSDEEMLATMRALKNPDWWDNMMMPGFSWPEAASSPSSNGNSPPASYSQSSYSPSASYPIQYPNAPTAGGVNMFQTAQVGLY